MPGGHKRIAQNDSPYGVDHAQVFGRSGPGVHRQAPAGCQQGSQEKRLPGPAGPWSRRGTSK